MPAWFGGERCGKGPRSRYLAAPLTRLDLRSLREDRVRVVDAEGIVYANVEPDHGRQLSTVVGTVGVSRLAYRHLGASNLHPADAALNLPTELHSHGLRRLAAIESTRGSFDEASEAIERSTGVAVAKRQVESLTAAAATDVEDFYAGRAPEPDASTEVMVVSVDGKGIVMRPDALREATARAASAAIPKLETRLSKARSATANGWPRWARSTTSAPSPAAPLTCSPPSTMMACQRHPRPRPPASGSPPAWPTTQQRWSPVSSTRQS
ncbi:MAG: hypothetical protein ACYCZP_14495, partial [Acidimicrobiales bacterium]